MAGRCGHCDGAGQDFMRGGITCGVCDGTGRKAPGVVEQMIAEHGFFQAMKMLTMAAIFVSAVCLVLYFAAGPFVRGWLRGPALEEATTGSPYGTVDHEVGECHPVGSQQPTSCDEPHFAEVYAIVYIADPDDGEYPGQPKIEEFAEDTCRPRFEAYAGSSVDELGLELRELLPNRESWAEGDREVLCGVIGTREALLTGSVRAG